MKKITASSGLFLISISIFAQNVGIGTTSPQARLDVLNSIRIGGNSSSISYDSLSGKFIWSNSYLFVPANQAIIKHSATQEGLYYNNQQLEYRNQSGNPVFYTNWSNGNAYFSGNVGIGVTVPQAPLHFASNLGQKIIMYGDDPDINYGIEIQPYEFRIHTPDNSAEIAFGYGNASNFNENLKITGNGAVGINAENEALQASLHVKKGFNSYGANLWGTQYASHFNFGDADLTYLRGGLVYAKLILNDIPGGKTGIGIEPTISDGVLEVAGRMRLRGGGTTAGIWLNKTNNSGLAAFIGMEDDNYVGFFGNVCGWKFGMNKQTGALKINGSEGATGNILQSNGVAAPPSWVSPTKGVGSNTYMLTSNIPVITNNNSPATDIPGLSYSFTAADSAKILVTYDLYTKNNGCSLCNNTNVYLNVVLDGNAVAMHAFDLVNGRDTQLSGVYLVSTGSGSHTIKIQGYSQGADITFSCTSCSYARRMVLQVINK